MIPEIKERKVEHPSLQVYDCCTSFLFCFVFLNFTLIINVLSTAELLGQYFKKIPEKRLINHVVTYVTVSSDLECIVWCRRHGNCSSVNHSSQSSELCELNDAREESFPEDLKHDKNYDYIEPIL